jgi:hypothetical protein
MIPLPDIVAGTSPIVVDATGASPTATAAIAKSPAPLATKMTSTITHRRRSRDLRTPIY